MKKGFTLIELLVVIAIIGLLSSIVLISMGGARTSGKDGSIKATMNSIRSMAELEYNEDGSYSGLIDRTDYVSAAAKITENDGAITSNIGSDNYCIESSLPGGGDWCIDSYGYAGTTTDCDATFDCAVD